MIIFKKTIFCLSIALCTFAHADISTTGENSVNLNQYKSQPVYIEFESSQKLTTTIKHQFETLGFKVVDDKNSAGVVLRFMCVYAFKKPHAKEQHVDFGKVVDQTEGDLIADADKRSTRGIGVELAPLVQGLQGNLSTGMVFGAGIVDSVMRMAGARSWFNKLVSGDERGVCLGSAETCKDWKKYDQQMRLGVFVEPAAGKQVLVKAGARTLDEQLQPEPLFQHGMQELTKRLFPESGAGMDPAAAPGETPARPAFTSLPNESMSPAVEEIS